jgi:hypothetical protein
MVKASACAASLKDASPPSKAPKLAPATIRLPRVICAGPGEDFDEDQRHQQENRRHPRSECPLPPEVNGVQR